MIDKPNSTEQFTEAVIRNQLMRIRNIADYIVQSELGPVYQAAKEIEALRDSEDDVLTEDAKALNKLVRDNERDAHVQKLYGVESFSQLTPSQRYNYLVFESPVTASESEERVVDATISVCDKLAEAAMANRPELVGLEIIGDDVYFSDITTAVHYSVTQTFSWDDARAQVKIAVRPDQELIENTGITPRPPGYQAALERARQVLDIVEDQALALLLPDTNR